jgi:hypothetical protein
MDLLKNTLTFFLFTAILFGGQHICAQNTNPYRSIKYDSVVMYDYDSPFRPIIDDDGNLEQTISKSTKLNEKEITELNAFLCEKSSFGNSASACFDPHLGIVYYKNGKPYGHLSICMSCNRLKANPDLPALDQDQIGMSKRFANISTIYY